MITSLWDWYFTSTLLWTNLSYDLPIGLLICGLINIALMGYIDALNISYPDSKTHLEVFKILLSFGCILCSVLMVMFHEAETETRELALWFGAIVLAIFTLQHVVALRFVSKQ